MSLCDHRIKIRNRMRKEYIKNIIIKARAEALEFSDKVGHEFTDQQSQDRIINTLKKAVLENMPINSDDILQHISRHEGEFGFRFRNEFAKLIITHFRTSRFCLLSLGVLIHKCQQIEVLNGLSISSFIKALFLQNGEETQANNKIEEIIELIYSLLNKNFKKEEFKVLQEYQTQIQELGFENITYIKFISLAITTNVCSPSEKAIAYYLEHDKSETIDYEPYFSYICSILTGFYSQRPFGPQFLLWLNRRLNEELFPEYLLKKLLSFIANSLYQGRTSESVVKSMAESCFDGFCLVVRERAFACRLQALKVIEQILNRSDPDICCALIERNGLLDMIASLLNSSMDNSLTLTLLVLLAWVLKSNIGYRQLVEQLGILTILNYYSFSANVRVAEVSELIIHSFELF